MASVSVIIPTWNRVSTLGAAIQSVLSQSIRPLEVLVCDDGSTDGTEQLVAEIAKEHQELRWLPGPRGGRPAIPRNRGIREARGEWVAFLDSDDTWEPEKLASQLAALQETGLQACCTNAIRLVGGDKRSGEMLSYQGGRVSFLDLCDVNQVICSSTVIHRSLFDAVGGFPEAIELKALEDYALWLRVATLTSFAYLSKPLVLYRDAPNESVRADDVDFYRQRIRVFKDFQRWAQKHAASGERVARHGRYVGKEIKKSMVRLCAFGWLRWIKRYIKSALGKK